MDGLTDLSFRPMDEDGALTLIGWRYEAPYDIYQLNPSLIELPTFVAFLVDPANRYYRIDSPRAELEAFCCVGDDAQVSGGDYAAEALDLGLGVRPDLTGRGLGAGYAQALAGFASRRFAPALLRVTIAGFNVRAQRVWKKIGFVQVQEFLAERTGRSFVILTRSPEQSGASGASHEYPGRAG
jgi:ribosomal-protein-alanine N-acetyltransferase